MNFEVFNTLEELNQRIKELTAHGHFCIPNYSCLVLKWS